GECSDFCNVIGRTYLDQIHPDELQSAQPPHNRLRLPTCQPSDFRCSRAWRERRVKYVDVETQVDWSFADHLADPFRDCRRVLLMHVLRGDHCDPSERPVVHLALNG